jgi:hypothetical protein
MCSLISGNHMTETQSIHRCCITSYSHVENRHKQLPFHLQLPAALTQILLFNFSDSPMLNLRTDEIYLTRFLNCCDWNVTDAFVRMTKLFKLKVNVTIALQIRSSRLNYIFRFHILNSSMKIPNGSAIRSSTSTTIF